MPLRCNGRWVGARVESADHAHRLLAGCTLLLRDALTRDPAGAVPAAGAGAYTRSLSSST